MEIKVEGDNINFGSKIYFSQDKSVKEKAINLFSQVGNSIIKEKKEEFIIDYPGEYEKYNIYIQVLKGNTDRLNFFIQDYDNREYFAFIQDPSVLENLDLTKYPDKWYYRDDVVFNQIERLGFEGETIKIG